MAQHLLFTVHLYVERYHGMGEPLPSPGRLFQALLAAASSGPTDPTFEPALAWLEALPAPLVALPTFTPGQAFETFVPDNDLDTVGSDPARASEIRSAKKIAPKLFGPTLPFLFAWPLPSSQPPSPHPSTLATLAEKLYQFGRGVDMAWARAHCLSDGALEGLCASYPGIVYRPSNSGRGEMLACPMPGTLVSLKARHAAAGQRLHPDGADGSARQLFTQPPKPRLAQVAYNAPPSRRLYELRQASPQAPLFSWPLTRASALVTGIRDLAAARLREALPDSVPVVDQTLIGRRPDGTNDGPADLRVRIIPLPSIGHQYADHAIRRVLVEVPAGSRIQANDVHWAFSGLNLMDPATGEALDAMLTPTDDDDMLRHFGAGNISAVWRSVTPIALPQSAARRRIPPNPIQDAKAGKERTEEEKAAAASIAAALRHARIEVAVDRLAVQREPFHAKGAMAEAFASGTRFPKQRLWHAQITFREPLSGPIILGDGRFLGLGIMAPDQRPTTIFTFEITDGLADAPDDAEIASALRRAVMARIQASLGPRYQLPPYFTGHETDGSPAKGHRHLSFLFDTPRARLVIVAPHQIEHRAPKPFETQALAWLASALAGFSDLRAGASGRLQIAATPLDPNSDPLFAASAAWQSVTPYRVTRHAKHTSADQALREDLLAECQRQGLPTPEVTITSAHGKPGSGLEGTARLQFAIAVPGPISLGKNRHLGGGLFATATSDPHR